VDPPDSIAPGDTDVVLTVNINTTWHEPPPILSPKYAKPRKASAACLQVTIQYFHGGTEDKDRKLSHHSQSPDHDLNQSLPKHEAGASTTT
jgi:hypothetical protein